MNKDVAFGQYYPAKSFVHNLDPRLKILFLVAFIVAIFMAHNFYGIAVCAFVLLLAVLLSKVPVLKVVASVKAVIFLLVFTSVLQLFFFSGETVLWQWWVLKITKEGIFNALFISCRLFLMVMVSAVLTLTTTPVALTDGLESLLYPLKLIKLPIHELALIMSIALRFIPTLTDETQRIMNAQKARGADFETGNVVKKVKAVIPVLIPLLISAFRRAEELGDAMDARCYSGSKIRTKYKKLTLSWRDLVASLFAAAMITAIVFMNMYLGVIM